MYKIDAETVITAEKYVTVAMKNLGYDIESILKIVVEMDKLFEFEKPGLIKDRAEKIMKPIFG